MTRYNCNGLIKIKVDLQSEIAIVKIVHSQLHPIPIDVTVPDNVKEFIKNNIDLLPREIYYKLVDEELDINIRQKQIHYW
jgi:hypothetical protein